jgi:2-oxoglutarate ferredoxin oxidoreductase subunit alpha
MPTRTQQSDITACAYASHGDTKHVLLFPQDPTECFEFSALAFDLADQLQTPIIIMSDLDLGMNDHLTEEFSWDDNKSYNLGKVLNAQQLDDIENYGRYLDTDGDGICYRTLPGTHPEKGAFFTRGTSRNEYAGYTEKSADYVKNMQRLTKKFDTASHVLPAPEINQGKKFAQIGLVYFGTSSHAITESKAQLKEHGLAVDTLRIKAFPFNDAVSDFINNHKQVFVIEQNRDGQMRSLLINEQGISPEKLSSIANCDGLPMTSIFIVQGVIDKLSGDYSAKQVS